MPLTGSRNNRGQAVFGALALQVYLSRLLYFGNLECYNSPLLHGALNNHRWD